MTNVKRIKIRIYLECSILSECMEKKLAYAGSTGVTSSGSVVQGFVTKPIDYVLRSAEARPPPELLAKVANDAAAVIGEPKRINASEIRRIGDPQNIPQLVDGMLMEDLTENGAPFSVSYDVLSAGANIEIHQHDHSIEVQLSLSDGILIFLNDGTYTLNMGELAVIPQGTWHARRNDQEKPAIMVSFKLPVGVPGDYRARASQAWSA